MKKIWSRLSVRRKVFLISVTLVVISTIFVYTALYAIVPRLYLFYKSEVAKSAVSQILDNYDSNSDIDLLFQSLNSFSYNDNVDILVKNDSGIVYLSSRFFQRFSNDIFTKNEQALIEKKFNIGGAVENLEFRYKPTGQKFVLEIRVPIQPVNQIAKVLLIFMPILVFITILISVISSFLYTKAVTKPLLKINDIAKSMAKLDFSKKLPVDGDDELSQLAVSLNEMSKSLEENINELERTNKKLLSDIEKERLGEKRRREFVGTISHELKSPITIVSGQLEGMMYNIGAFKDRDKYLKKSYDVMQEMRELVGEILELNKYESEAFKVEMEKINISNMVNDAINKKTFYLSERKISVRANIEDEIFVYADLKLIKKVFDNVISNAIKYTDELTEVEINLNRKNDLVNFEVINESEGLTSEEIEKIFNPFYRIEKSRNRKTGGSGLGLYIVKNIIDKHSNMKYKMISEEGKVNFNLEIEI